MRSPRPWYRRQTDTWYVCLFGKQTPLAKGKHNRKEAERVFHQIMAGEAPRESSAALPHRLTLRQIAGLFLKWAKKSKRQPARTRTRTSR